MVLFTIFRILIHSINSNNDKLAYQSQLAAPQAAAAASYGNHSALGVSSILSINKGKTISGSILHADSLI